MSHEQPIGHDVRALMEQVSVTQVAEFYGAALPPVESTRDDVRTRCFLNCGRCTETADDALVIQADQGVKPWHCQHDGCEKRGDLMSLCDLLKPDRNGGGRPKGRRFWQIVSDLRAMADQVIAEPASGDEAATTDEDEETRQAAPPRGPENRSPVPWLTSIHSTVHRGPYGDRRYRGNCSGYLIKDLLRYFEVSRVLDPMTGSGTCKDVCRELGVVCDSMDIKTGFDASNPECFERIGTFDFIWLHPPYWRQIRYGDDPNCLSNAASLNEFLERMRDVIGNCVGVLRPQGKLAILIGDYADHNRRIPLVSLTANVAIDEGLWPACTDIVRVQHGNTSSERRYRSSFIPGLHDVCMVFERRPGGVADIT